MCPLIPDDTAAVHAPNQRRASGFAVEGHPERATVAIILKQFDMLKVAGACFQQNVSPSFFTMGIVERNANEEYIETIIPGPTATLHDHRIATAALTFAALRFRPIRIIKQRVWIGEVAPDPVIEVRRCGESGCGIV